MGTGLADPPPQTGGQSGAKMYINPTNPARRTVMDMWLPLVYTHYQLGKLKQLMTEPEALAQDSDAMERRRSEFRSKFWSNSQYWH